MYHWRKQSLCQNKLIRNMSLNSALSILFSLILNCVGFKFVSITKQSCALNFREGGCTKRYSLLHMHVDDFMIPEYEKLSFQLVERVKNNILSSQHWVGIAGGPGSGKSTLAAAVCERINTQIGSEISVVLPMDGFHYSRKELKEMGEKGPYTFEELIARRGSPWTFNGPAVVRSLTAAKANKMASLPIYSRKLSDPVSDGVQLLESHRIVLVEGNYLLNWDDPEWSGLRDVFDEKWFISCTDPLKQRDRLIKRHLETWTPEKDRMFGPGEFGAAKKTDFNDYLNMLFVDKHRQYADYIIKSI